MDDRIKKCPECGSKNLITDPKHAELYCADCGVVIAENLVDPGPEWRSYDEEQALKRVRTGPPMSYRIHNKGLSTSVPEVLTRTKKLRGIINMDSSEKILSFALGEIDRMASALKLPTEIREATSVLYRRAAKQNLIKGRSIEELASAMLYIVCRQYHVPRTLKEIEQVSRVPLRKIRRAYIFLVRRLGIKLAPADPAQYVPRFCSELGLSDAIRERAIEILKANESAGTAKGWGPTGTAAAAIYLAANLSGVSVSEKDIAKVAGTTPITIRNRCKELEDNLKINTDTDILSYPHQKGAYFVI